MTQIEREQRRIKCAWTKLRNRAARSPHGEKRKREAELRQFTHDQLRQEVSHAQ